MNVARPSEIAKESYVSDIFTGPVTRQPVAPNSRDYNVNIINFAKGIRNKPHTHESDQVLIVTAGTGIVAAEGKERVVTTGDVILIPAGEVHWHGATPDSDFSHIAMTRSDSKTVIVGE